jgi:hypothetical protein
VSRAQANAWDDPIVWWKDHAENFPRMARLAKKYLAVPASSVPSERLFSSAGNFAQKRRGRLFPDTLEREVLLHHYLNERKRLDYFVPATVPLIVLS